MMNDITVINSTKYNIEHIIENMTNIILAELELNNISISINIVTDDEIKSINKEYRFKDKVTDVITFSYEDVDNFNDLFAVRELGDVFIAIDYVNNNCKLIGNTMSREVSFVLAHGILHTLGYSHDTLEDEKVMFELQEKLIREVIKEGSELNEIFN